MPAVEEGPYRAPQVDDEAPRDEELDEDADDTDTVEWYAVSGTRVLLGSFFGGWLYQTYWMYRWWRCYRRSLGYGRAPFWRAVQARTGYQVSPVWRALFGSGYVFCLLPAVAREAKRANLPGFGPPITLALVYGLSGLSMALAGQNGLLIERAAQSIILFGAQLTVNRLNDRCPHPRPFASVTGGEVLCLLGGIALTLSVFAGRT